MAIQKWYFGWNSLIGKTEKNYWKIVLNKMVRQGLSIEDYI